MTSEEKYGISEQPDDTCPLINHAQDCIKDMMNTFPSSRMMRNADEEELRGMLQDAEETVNWEGEKADEKLEEIRERVTKIRAWGQDWKDFAKDMAGQVDAVQTPWDGIKLWWYQVGEDNWRATWLWKTCFKPIPKIPKVKII